MGSGQFVERSSAGVSVLAAGTYNRLKWLNCWFLKSWNSQCCSRDLTLLLLEKLPALGTQDSELYVSSEVKVRKRLVRLLAEMLWLTESYEVTPF